MCIYEYLSFVISQVVLKHRRLRFFAKGKKNGPTNALQLPIFCWNKHDIYFYYYGANFRNFINIRKRGIILQVNHSRIWIKSSVLLANRWFSDGFILKRLRRKCTVFEMFQLWSSNLPLNNIVKERTSTEYKQRISLVVYICSGEQILCNKTII